MSDTRGIVALGLVAVGSMLWQVYSWTWRPRDLAGTYEHRRPGEFADERAPQHLVEALPDPREYRHIPPAPQPPALLRFRHPTAGTVYVDGRPVGNFTVRRSGNCDYLRLPDGHDLTRAGCPL